MKKQKPEVLLGSMLVCDDHVPVGPILVAMPKHLLFAQPWAVVRIEKFTYDRKVMEDESPQCDICGDYIVSLLDFYIVSLQSGYNPTEALLDELS